MGVANASIRRNEWSILQEVVILNDVRGDFHYNFSHVTPSQLLAKLYYECDQNLAGPANEECHHIAKENLMLIYTDLQAGKGAYFICQQLDLC
ncbi:surfactant protein B [Ancylostoma ceylanicum]|uniref:Surfactant protein B n=1 Tax=Ancylostoma ceylanicum TaxID=53326 RepID=A0A0D6LP74_9BILA|nr:surfactant protein B [Ancylostoma ceylanicum]